MQVLIKEAFSWISLCTWLLLRAAINLNGSSVSLSPEKVPEKTPGAWLTKLSMMAPGLRERVEGPVPLLGLLGLQFACRKTDYGAESEALGFKKNA